MKIDRNNSLVLDSKNRPNTEHNIPPNENLLIKPRLAAEKLAISERKLWSLTASGEIPHIRIGRSVRYTFEDLCRWIDQKRQ